MDFAGFGGQYKDGQFGLADPRQHGRDIEVVAPNHNSAI